MIKFLDLQKVNERFQNEFQEKFKSFLDSGHYILGDQVSSFENNYAKYCGVEYCVGVSNGLDALILIFKAYLKLGLLQCHDEILVPANTFIGSVLAIEETGLKPVLIEPDLETYNISVLEIEKNITPKTKAILAVHLYGMLADMESINIIAKKNNLLVIEDAAQAHGAVDKYGVMAGALSDVAAFSFYPSKNLGALGDAGAVVSNNEALIHMIKKLRNYGGLSKYVYDIVGSNNRLDEVQAIFLNVKLKLLDEDNKLRRNIAKLYLSGITNKKVSLPYYNSSNNHVFYAFVVLVKNRQDFIDYLNRKKIETLIHYPIPPHKQRAFSHLKFANLPITETIHNRIVSLPMSPVMLRDEVEEVIKAINLY